LVVYKNIVVAIDGSSHSQAALEHAILLAEKFDAAVWLVHVFPRTSDLLGYDEYESLVAKRENEGQKILEKARGQFQDSVVVVRTELLEGPEAEAILTVAETRQADLIVMGTRGFSSLQGLLLGSVSQKVIQHAHCPVMVVR
jgi:nucleotide-binding universal stress UspA family protein